MSIGELLAKFGTMQLNCMNESERGSKHICSGYLIFSFIENLTEILFLLLQVKLQMARMVLELGRLEELLVIGVVGVLYLLLRRRKDHALSNRIK